MSKGGVAVAAGGSLSSGGMSNDTGSGGGKGGTSGKSGSGGSGDSGGTGGGVPCAAAKPEVISDFEEGNGGLVRQGGRIGWWYVYADAVAGAMQTPAANPGGPIAVATAPSDTPGICNRYALHSTSTGHTQYVGLGADFVPDPPPAKTKAVYDVSAYKGISFNVKASTLGHPPVFFEVLTQESQPPPPASSGVATNTATNLYNNRGHVLAGISPTWTKMYVPFATLVPRWLPAPATNPGSSAAACAPTDFCEAPPFVPGHTLSIQLSLYPDSPTLGGRGSYDLWLDDVSFYKDDVDALGKTLPSFTDKKWATCTRPAAAAMGSRYLFDAFTAWKSTFVRSADKGLRVVRPENGDDSVSEGIAYGMLIAVSMKDQPLFDGLHTYWKAHGTPLMSWCIPSGPGSCTPSGGSATDADEDAAFALLKASKVWPGTSYGEDAKKLMGSIYANDIDSVTNIPKGGSQFADINPSYFAPAYYREFAKADTENPWAKVVDAVYTALANIDKVVSFGLVPAWCSTPSCTAIGGRDAYYQYDSHRVPWRFGIDACWSGETRGRVFLAKQAKFFADIAAKSATSGGGIARVVDTYETTGAPHVGSSPNSMSMLGTAAVGAMAAGGRQPFVDAAFQAVVDGLNRATLGVDPSDPRKSNYSYYNATVGLLAALTLTGNFYPD